MTAATVLPGAGAFITSGSGQALVYQPLHVRHHPQPMVDFL